MPKMSAKTATKGVLTRLALIFDANPQQVYTGAQVTEILLRVITVIEHGTERPEQAAELESGQ